jgi:hypothetical protein
MEAKEIKNWGLDVKIKNLMTGEKRTEYFKRVESVGDITPLYLSPSGHFYTVGILGLFCVDNYIK